MELEDQKEIYINHLKELIANILEIEEEPSNSTKNKISTEIDIQREMMKNKNPEKNIDENFKGDKSKK